ncbi:bifunctional DNA primase/polymerase [Nocardia sp.]|uniref:bifunctional DNA primase/polymerase n=1 Tax=Nocardia sp. TaxID=1821 RepID=UPI00338D500D
MLTGDTDAIRAAWPTRANIGIGCRASGIVGIDPGRHTDRGINAGADGVAGFAALCRLRSQPHPVTFAVATPNAFRHLHFRVPPV